MNSYFASVEQAANPALRGKPVAVGGGIGKRTVVATSSYEARACGVKTGMPAWEALKICPELVLVEGDMSKYIYTSREIMKMLHDYTDLVEVFSIDDAFLDITLTQQRFGGSINIARDIKKRIRERFRLTCSIGIASNKLVAKAASNLKKPDGLTVITPEEVPLVFEFLAVEELCGIGRQLKKHLNRLGVMTCGELARYPVHELIHRFGLVAGVHLSNMGKGIDDSPVNPGLKIAEPKSISHSYTLPKNEEDADTIKSYLLNLCERVGKRARKEGLKGRVVGLFLRFADFGGFGKQKDLKEYIDDGLDIYNAALKIGLPGKPVRAIGVWLSRLTKADQISIFEQVEAKKNALKAMDEINDRWGDFTITRASIIYNELQKKCGFASRGNFIKIMPDV